MTLADVAELDPHVAAHNEERHAINDLSDALADEAALARNADNLDSGTINDARISGTIARSAELASAVAAEAALARNAINLTSGLIPDARLSTAIARQADVTVEIAAAVTAGIDAVIAGAPGALDTLFEISEALADESDAIAALVTSIADEAALARNADNLTSGTVADARIASTIARDSEVSSAISTSEAGQVRDGDAAGGVLSGTYPSPGFAVDMATQAELDVVAGIVSQMNEDRIPTSVGQETFPRALASTVGTVISTQNVHLTYFTAYADGTITALAAYTGSTGWSGATPTTIKMGLYSVNVTTGELTRIGITASDTTLFATNTTRYPKALLSSVAVTKGTRYAFAVLVDSSGTLPMIAMNAPSLAASYGHAPKARLHARLTAQTDIPTTIADSALSPTGSSRCYGEIIY